MILFDLDISDILLLLGLGICFIIQLLFYWIVFAKPYRYVKKNEKNTTGLTIGRPPVSVIVAVRNQYDDLNHFLSSILEQDYPCFEVIVISEGDNEENELTISRLKTQYRNLYLTKIPDKTRNISRKKLALSLGVKAAKYEHLLFTEPDSCPQTPNWITSMLQNFNEDKSIILGLSVKGKGKGFLNKYIAFDYLFSGLKFLSLALYNRPYAGDGHNLAYLKKHFEQERGYSKYHFITSGEDDLFINTIATKNNTAVELSPESIVVTRIDGFRDYTQRKLDRHFSSRFLKRGPIAFWRMELFFRIGFYLFFVACFVEKGVLSILSIVATFLFIVRLLTQTIVWVNTSKRIGLEKPSIFSSLYDILQPLMNLYFYLHGLLKKKDRYVAKL